MEIRSQEKKEVVLIMGGTGFIGQELGLRLVRLGYHVRVLTRHPSIWTGKIAYPCELFAWPDDNKTIPPEVVCGLRAVINLSGASIFDMPWSEAGKKILKSSRIRPIERLKKALEAYGETLPIFLQASAVGYYGDCGDQTIDEFCPCGDGFLATLCEKWEAQVHALGSSVGRTCIFRIAPVLGLAGGILKKLDSIYGAGFSANLAGGKHFFPWIHIEDLCDAFLTALNSEQYIGVFNAVSPQAITFSEFHHALIDQKSAPSVRFANVPRFLLKILFGQKSELLLASQKAQPKRLEQIGFSFKFPTIASALKQIYRFQKRPALIWETRRQWIPCPIDFVWHYFSNEKNLENITPPWIKFRVLGKDTDTIKPGTLIRYRLSLHGLPMRWVSEIVEWVPMHYFVDEQRRGPYRFWNHRHDFEALRGGTLVSDLVQFRLRFGFIGNLFGFFLVMRGVKKNFDYRAAQISKF